MNLRPAQEGGRPACQPSFVLWCCFQGKESGTCSTRASRTMDIWPPHCLVWAAAVDGRLVCVKIVFHGWWHPRGSRSRPRQPCITRGGWPRVPRGDIMSCPPSRAPRKQYMTEYTKILILQTASRPTCGSSREIVVLTFLLPVHKSVLPPFGTCLCWH